jgi:hypothetical protein
VQQLGKIGNTRDQNQVTDCIDAKRHDFLLERELGPRS